MTVIHRHGRLLSAIHKLLVFASGCVTVYVYLYMNTSYQRRTALVEIGNTTNHVVDTTRTVSNHSLSYNDTTSRLLTLFTTWKNTPDKVLVHDNTMANWLLLKNSVILILFIDDQATRNKAEKLGWNALPVPKKTQGVPVLKHMYLAAMKAYKSHFYGYANGDILFTKSLVDTLLTIKNSLQSSYEPALIIGRRTNVKGVTKKEAFDWTKLTNLSKSKGKLFEPYAEDYFIATANYKWQDIPEVIVGKRAYDNWLVLNNRKQKYRTIEATSTLLAIHQTTRRGDYEGKQSPNANYNVHLLEKLYKKIHYYGGLTGCSEEYTKLEKNKVVIKKRKPPKGC